MIYIVSVLIFMTQGRSFLVDIFSFWVVGFGEDSRLQG